MVGRPALSEEQIEAFRQRACAAAIELFADRDEVSLRQLATALGCSHATPYRYFESKEELFMAVRAECYRRLAKALETRLEAIDDPYERLMALMEGYATFAHDHRAEFRLMFQVGAAAARCVSAVSPGGGGDVDARGAGGG